MRAASLALLVLVSCPAPAPRGPQANTGPALVVFSPWIQERGATPPSTLRPALDTVTREVFSSRGALFEEEALRAAAQTTPCQDEPCAADVARRLGASWYLTGQVLVFPPAHCFVLFTARSFDTGAELLGYDPGQVAQNSFSDTRAELSLRNEALKRCDDPAFIDQARASLRKMADDPGLQPRR